MEEVVDKDDLKQEMVDKWSIKPSLAEKMVDILQFVADKEENLQQKSEPIVVLRCRSCYLEIKNKIKRIDMSKATVKKILK